MIAYGKQFVGVPYAYGGIDASGMDCSGFIFTVARESIGVQLPRTVSALYANVKIIDDMYKEPGDIVFFRTVGNKISHAGLYMGNNQFMHAVSDGPNTGVIVSSLKETYWKNAYAGAGQFLPASTYVAGSESVQIPVSGTEDGSRPSAASGSAASGSFASGIVLDASLGVNWNLFTADRFLLNFRGVSVDVHARYGKWAAQPGLGVGFTYDPSMHVFQIPLLFSVTLSRGIRVYAGPVFSIGSAVEPGSGDSGEGSRIEPSIFPGVIGVCWQSPSISAGGAEFSLMQDIRYSVFNKTNGAALPFLNSMAAGLVLSSGLRVTFPLSRFL